MDVTPEKLIQNMRGVARDAEILIKATASEAREGARAARAKLAGALAVARESCNRFEQANLERALTARRLVWQKPYETTLLALASGFILGILTVRLFHRSPH